MRPCSRVVSDGVIMGEEGFRIRSPYSGSIESTVDLSPLHLQPRKCCHAVQLPYIMMRRDNPITPGLQYYCIKYIGPNVKMWP